jgi:hypothetical protein
LPECPDGTCLGPGVHRKRGNRGCHKVATIIGADRDVDVVT